MHQSERLIFRPLEKSDAERLFEIYSDVEAMKYRQVEAHKNIKDTYEMLSRDKEMSQLKKEIRFGVIKKDTNDLIGSFMYQPLDNKALIGYSLSKEEWGNGFATEIVEWLVSYLKNEKFTLLEAWVMNENIKSSKVLIKNNFNLISQTIYPNSKYYQKYL